MSPNEEHPLRGPAALLMEMVCGTLILIATFKDEELEQAILLIEEQLQAAPSQTVADSIREQLSQLRRFRHEYEVEREAERIAQAIRRRGSNFSPN